MLASQRNAKNFKRVCSEPRGLAPAGSPTPEMVAGSLNQATAKPYYDIRSLNTLSRSVPGTCENRVSIRIADCLVARRSLKHGRHLCQYFVDDLVWNAFQPPSGAGGEIESARLVAADDSRGFSIARQWNGETGHAREIAAARDRDKPRGLW